VRIIFCLQHRWLDATVIRHGVIVGSRHGFKKLFLSKNLLRAILIKPTRGCGTMHRLTTGISLPALELHIKADTT